MRRLNPRRPARWARLAAAILPALGLLAASPAARAVTAEVRIATSSDDAEESASGSVSLSSSDLELVYDGSNQTVGIRFAGLAVPRGATITAAWVQFTADESQSEATVLTIRAQAVDDAPTFGTGSFGVSSRQRTAASQVWNPPAWASGAAAAAQRTPDLAPVVQEVVDRPAWASGRALAVIVTGTGHRTAWAYDRGASGAALLHVEYELAPTSCTPDPLYYPTPALGWDLPPVPGVTGYRLRWRYQGETAWRGSLTYPCMDGVVCDDSTGECLPAGRWCPGGDLPHAAPGKWIDPEPGRIVEWAAWAYGPAGESLQPSNVVQICWPEQQRWGF